MMKKLDACKRNDVFDLQLHQNCCVVIFNTGAFEIFRKAIKDYFENEPLGWGSTFSYCPISMACSYATIKYIIDNKILENVKK